MAIDYTVNIVEALFVSDVKAETAYQVPGDFGLPTSFSGTISLRTGSTVQAAGTSYHVSDVLTLTGGTQTTTAQVTVTAINGTGGVTAFTVSRAGAYTVVPPNPVSVSGGNGSNFKLTASWAGLAENRILTFVEVMRSYLAEIDDTHEAKLLQEVMGRILAQLRFGAGIGGAGWNGASRATLAQRDALRFIAAHVLPADL